MVMWCYHVTECKITAWDYIVVFKLQEPAFAMPIFICKGEAKAMKYSNEHEECLILCELFPLLSKQNL